MSGGIPFTGLRGYPDPKQGYLSYNGVPSFAQREVAALLKFYGQPAPGFNSAEISGDQFSPADSLLKAWGNSFDVLKGGITQTVMQFSIVNTLVLPFKFCRTMQAQLNQRIISRPMHARTAEHGPYRKVTTSNERMDFQLHRYALGAEMSAEVLADSEVGQEEYYAKLKAIIEGLMFAMEYDALEHLVHQNTYEIMALATRSIVSPLSQFTDFIQNQVWSYLGLGKKGNGLEFLIAAVSNIGTSIGYTFDTVILPSGARQLERATNMTTRKLTIEVDGQMAQLAGTEDKMTVMVNSFHDMNIITQKPAYDDVTKRMHTCPLTRPSATASHYDILIDGNGVISPLQIIDHNTHQVATITPEKIMEQLKYVMVMNGDNYVYLNGTGRDDDDVDMGFLRDVLKTYKVVLVRPAQYIAGSSVIFCKAKDAGYTLFHLSMMKFGNNVSDGTHSIEGDAYFSCAITNPRAVLVVHDYVPGTILGGMGTRFMPKNSYDFVDCVTNKKGDLYLMLVPIDCDTNRLLALSAEAAEMDAAEMIGNPLSSYKTAVNDKNARSWATTDPKTSDARLAFGFQQFEVGPTVAPIKPNGNFRQMENRITQFSMPGTCWQQNNSGEFTIEKKNSGHLGSIDSVSRSRFLRGQYQIMEE